MGKPDSQQRGLAGEYYVAYVLSRLGYDVSITIGRAKIIDMMALATSGKEISIQIGIQVKCTYTYNDWLVAHEFDSSKNSVVALVRLGKEATQRPELYFLPGVKANELITHKYKTHSPRIGRSDVQVGIIYVKTIAKACRCLRMERILGAERDGASPISPSNE